MATQREFDGQAGMDLGVGFDAVASEVRGDCVVRREPEGAGGEEVFFAIDLISSRQELMRRMNISAAASMRVALGSGSAKARYFSDQNINQFSLYIVVTCTVQHASRRMRDVVLNTPARELLERGNTDAFRRRCGDEFLVGYTTGGEFYGVFELQTRSVDEQQNARASIRASGAVGIYSGSGSAGFGRAIQSLSEQFDMRFRMYSVGGNPDTLPTTASELIEYARTFPQLVRGEGAKKYVATFLDYGSIDLPDGPNPIDVQNQKDVIDRLAIQRLQYLDVISNIEYVLLNPVQFATFDSQSLNAKLNELRDAVNRIVQASSRCSNDIRECRLLTDLPDPAILLPERMTSSCIGAIDLAKRSAEMASSHATACEGFARRILEISRIIRTGAEGVRLADEATVLLESARASHRLVVHAVEDAITTTGVCPGTEEHVESARRFLEKANEDLSIAVEKYDLCYKIGYAPYWDAPTQFVFVSGQTRGLLFRDTASIAFAFGDAPDMYPTLTYYLKLDDYCKDPKGPVVLVDPTCDTTPYWTSYAPTYLCPLGPYRGYHHDQGDLCGIWISPQGAIKRWNDRIADTRRYGVLIIGLSDVYNGDQRHLPRNTPLTGSFVLRSNVTGLRTVVTISVIAYEARLPDANTVGDYIYAFGYDVGDAVERGRIVRNDGTRTGESIAPLSSENRPLGWISSPID